MKFKKYHRKYPDSKWDYRAISTRVENKEIIFYTLNDKGIKSQGIELFQGSNPDSSERSYSRRYNLKNLPEKYKKTVSSLKRKHKSTKWSKKDYVNLN